MSKNKKCGFCHIVKSFEQFHKDRTKADNYTSRCIKCTKLYYTKYYQKIDNKESHFPYKSLKDPKYIKDKIDLFKKSGNGWWWQLDKIRPRKGKGYL